MGRTQPLVALPAPPARVVDPTGAGDATVGALAASAGREATRCERAPRRRWRRRASRRRSGPAPLGMKFRTAGRGRRAGIGATHDSVVIENVSKATAPSSTSGLRLSVAKGVVVTLARARPAAARRRCCAASRASSTPMPGRILSTGEDISHLPPNRRDVGFVFQNYALFPHLTSGQRRLRAEGQAQAESRDPRAGRGSAGLVRPDGVWRPLPDATLGRPAAARRHRPRRWCWSRGPAARRAVQRARRQAPAAMQVELRKLIDRVGITSIFVTHDQEEAMTLSRPHRGHARRPDRAVRAGRWKSTTTRRTPFVADFIGRANLSRCRPGRAASDGHGAASHAGQGAGTLVVGRKTSASPRDQVRLARNASASRRRSGHRRISRSTCGLAEPLRVVAAAPAGRRMLGVGTAVRRRHRRALGAALFVEGRAGHDGDAVPALPAPPGPERTRRRRALARRAGAGLLFLFMVLPMVTLLTFGFVTIDRGAITATLHPEHIAGRCDPLVWRLMWRASGRGRLDP